MVRGGPLVGLIGQVGVLAGLDVIIGIGLDGWLVGLAYGLVTAVALTVGIVRATGAGRAAEAGRSTDVAKYLDPGEALDAGRTPSCAEPARKASFPTSGSWAPGIRRPRGPMPAFSTPGFRTSDSWTSRLRASGLLTSGLKYADWVTLARATLVGGVAALVVHGRHTDVAVAPLVVIASVALALDAVDGLVARRTGTASPLGARFDMEVDAFLILVLSVSVAPQLGAWVLAIGAMRYAYVVAGWALPWLRRPLPPRYWRKVVAAIQGITLTAVTSGLFPVSVCVAAVAVALALLIESFGRDVVWQWHRRHDGVTSDQVANERTTHGDEAHPIEGPERQMSPSG